MSEGHAAVGPPYWTADMPELVARREPIRGVEKWQTTYVRYKCQPETQPSPNGWELAVSQRLLEQCAVNEQQRYMLKDHPINSGLAPTSVNLRIIEAPAEYCVPVKQDRRLTPDFKVRVEVKYRGRVQFPVSLKAYIITQQERDSLHSWAPEELYDPESPKRKHITELKGTTVVTHLFEANTNGVQHYSQQRGISSRRAGPPQPSPSYPGYPPHHSRAPPHYMDLQQGMPMGMDPLSLSHHEPLSLRDPVTTKGRDPLLAPPRDHMYPTDSPYPHHMYAAPQDPHPLDGLSYVSLDPMAGQSSAPLPAYPSGGAMQPLDSWDHDYDNALIHQLLQSAGGYSHSSLLQHLEGGYAPQQGPPGPVPPHHPSSIKPEPGRYSATGPMTPTMDTDLPPVGVPPAPLAPEATLTHDFEFSNVEFLKPTRMNKVYMLFACSILEHDSLLVMYDIPTVGICRAEQRAKACQKLSIPYGDVGHIEHLYAPPVHLHSNANNAASSAAAAAGATAATADAGGAGTKRRSSTAPAADDVPESGTQRPFERQSPQAGPAAMQSDDYNMATLPRSRRALREWILEEYENTGLTRKLTELDIQALESQAGFPQDMSAESCSVSQQQWDEFKAQFHTVLQLLTCIAPVWNLEDPCLISGFDMDRQGTVQALAHEPAGTFICRFSMSQPGCLVLTTKVPAGNPNADTDGLVHAIIKIDDLNERRVDTWIRDFAGATHILDVYKQKRVDKRKVFASNYTRLRNLELPEAFEGL